MKVAERIASRSPVATQWAKAAMDKTLDLSYTRRSICPASRGLSQPSGESGDGVRSFLEHRESELAVR